MPTAERAPYLNYTEITSYQEFIDNGCQIPIFVVKSDKQIDASEVAFKNVLRYTSYTKFKKDYSIDENDDELDSSLENLNDILKAFFEENSMYETGNTYGLTVPFVYILDIGKNPTVAHYENALSVSEKRRNSTVVVFPDTEDIDFMNAVKTKLMQESKDGFLRISYFGVSGEGEYPYETVVGEVASPTLNCHGYSNIVHGELKSTPDTTEPDDNSGDNNTSNTNTNNNSETNP